jgi:3-dehydroquinate dehydratase/shikimate dehydrogenase
MDRLRALRGHVLKLAIQVDDAVDLADLVALGRSRDRPVVLIGMGAAGLLSRACFRRFGSAWTYVAARPEEATAPGQVCWDQLLRWRLDRRRDPSPIVLLGGPQIHGSPGPAVYNRLFAELDAPYIYLPVQTDRPEQAMTLLRDLGLHGASVTMPLKERISGSLDSVDEAGRAINAVNTIWRAGRELHGTNTDGLGVVRTLEQIRPLNTARVVVLGAGGTARAAVWALLKAGAQVEVRNRTREKAEQLASELGRGVRVIDRLGQEPFEILVNATSLGLDGCSTPVDDKSVLASKIVLDCVAQPPRTPLLVQAESVGAVAISGVELWLHQGAAQASLWLGREVSADDLRRLLPTRPEKTQGSADKSASTLG